MVFDASAALSALLNAGPARLSLAEEQIHVPHLIDAEVASGLRRKVLDGVLDVADGWAVLEAWSRLGVLRYPSFVLAAAADRRLAGASGLNCAVTVVPR
jgi:predicted nucleic acid-binding protein